jgi:pimeloyl-ACP methyl ester carboxylesterase
MNDYLPEGVTKELYPFTGKYHTTASGARLHYLDEGAGRPVVMLHGNPTWSFYFRNLLKELSGTNRVIVPDHIGCGLSDKPGDDKYDYTLKSRADDIEGLLDGLGIKEDITLVLHDWGGMIGMTWAARHPERVARLVLLNTGAFFLPPEKSFPPAMWLARTALGTLLVRGFNAFAAVSAYVCVTRRPLTPELRRAYTAPYNNWANRIATLRFVQDVPVRPGDKAFEQVDITQRKLGLFSEKPALICWGLKDFIFDEHFLETWKRHLPKAEIHTFADAGHYILEDAAEDVLPLVKKFIANA